ncbi:MAG: NAD+ synthase [Phycisphaerales bacterium]|jgi:NAD+ synthetase|nr:NAD+ synthase [Phycisphaerales bacterium]
MRLALAQTNPTIGAIERNAEEIARAIDHARAQHADLVVFPELAICGYPPKDLLLQEGFIEACAAAAKRLGEQHSAGLTLVLGTPLPADDRRGVANSLVAYRDGQLVDYYDKRLLPTYDVFDEDRYFTPGHRPVIIEVAGLRVGLSICEDLWRGEDVGFSSHYHGLPDPVTQLVHPPADSPWHGRGAQLIVNPSASPFRVGIGARHRALLRTHATKHRVHVAAVNLVGGNDELIFDGSACCLAPDGTIIAAGPSFKPHITFVDIPAAATPVTDPLTTMPVPEATFHALVLGVRDYCAKTGFKTAVLGLSGGIDSAVVAVIAAVALGPANILGVGLPSRYSSQGSIDDARALADRLAINWDLIPIEPPFASMLSTLAPAFAGRDADVTEENLQSRLRGTILMALSNKFGRLLLTTGNKSELAVGYCTLYGDMNGGLAVVADLLKTDLYALARWINTHHHTLGLRTPPIPEATITKPPSAELRPNQTDQDSLPPYDVLDEILRRRVEQRHSAARLIADLTNPAASAAPIRADEPTIRRVLRLIDIAEFKRKQAAIGLKLSSVAFGSGRRVPIAQGWRG